MAELAEAGRWNAAPLHTRGILGWALARLRGAARPAPRLAVLDRITLAPRQSLALIEAEGRRLLIATSPDAAPTFYALDQAAPPTDSLAGRTPC